MRKMLSAGENNCGGFRKPFGRAAMMRNGAAALLTLGVFVFLSGPAHAFPIGGHPDKCKGGVPDGAFTCENHGGTVACTNDGDYMCCTKNAQGGQDCEQIESKPANPKGSLRQQVFPGAKGPVLRRGVEGEQPAEPVPGAPTSPEQPSGTKP
jgi:hypothetical protein